MNNKLFETQDELFKEFKEPKKQRGFFRKNIFSSQTVFINLSYEKTVFIIVILIMLILASFSLGVERGRHLRSEDNLKAAPKANMSLPLANKPNIADVKYTIQVNSFSDQPSADRESLFLKSRGYKPYILKSGNIYKVCVGLFSDEETARPVLLKLKPKYQDSFIRKR